MQNGIENEIIRLERLVGIENRERYIKTCVGLDFATDLQKKEEPKERNRGNKIHPLRKSSGGGKWGTGDVKVILVMGKPRGRSR